MVALAFVHHREEHVIEARNKGVHDNFPVAAAGSPDWGLDASD